MESLERYHAECLCLNNPEQKATYDKLKPILTLS